MTLLGLAILGAAILLGLFLSRPPLKSGPDMSKMSMNMEDNRAPSAVSVQAARLGSVSAAITYTGAAAPYLEDTVYPRVTGRILDTLYVGDHVTAGQVVARLQQPDLVAKAEQSRFAAAAANQDIGVNEAQARQVQIQVRTAQAGARGAAGSVLEARQNQLAASGAVTQADEDYQTAIQQHETARAEVAVAQGAVQESQAKLESARADAAYWQPELQREGALLAGGAVSLDEYQSEQAKSKTAASMVRQVQAELRRTDSSVISAQAKEAQAGSQVRSVQAHSAQARVSLGAQAAKVSQAEAAAQAARDTVASAITGTDVAARQVARSQANLGQAKAGQAEAEANEGYLIIRTPESGVVTRRLADPGVVVSPGMGILKIARLDPVRLQANLSLSDRSRARVGMSVTAKIEGLPAPIEARISRIFPSANESTRTSMVEAIVPNPGGRILPGQFLTLTLHEPAAHRSLLIPLSAIVSLTEGDQAGSGVWTVADDKAHLVPVTLGATDGANREILTGLKEGALVITSGTEDLSEGTKVSYARMPGEKPGAASPGRQTGAQPMAGMDMGSGSASPVKGSTAYGSGNAPMAAH